jgi:hypothetical protein
VRPRARHVAWLLILGTGALGARADQEAAPADPRPVYQDRLIDGGTLAADVSFGDPRLMDPDGWSRTFRAEGITSRVSRDGVDQDEHGLRLAGMIDTPNHGAITLDANLRSSDGYAYGSDTGYTVSLYQIGMPMNGHWRVNNAIGVGSSPAVDLARNQQRFWVPSTLQDGMAAEWRKAGALQLHASFGSPGLLTGIYVPTFEDLGGEQVSAGVQWNGAGSWSAAVQAVNAEDVSLGLGPLNSTHTRSGTSVFGAVGWGERDLRAQLNLVQSSPDGMDGGIGAWLDAAIQRNRVRHTLGAFHFDPDLYWGHQTLASDFQGGYYRAAFDSRRWTLDGGVDYLMPVEGEGDSTLFGTGYARYQVSSRLGLGGGGNVREDAATAWSVFGFVDLANGLGIGRAQVDYAMDDLRERTQLTLNQTWDTPAGTRLGSSLIVGRDSYLEEAATTIGLAVNGGGDLRSNLAVDVNARWDNVDGRERTDNLLATVALNWRFARGWTVGANYYVSQNTWRAPLGITSPIDELPLFAERRTDDQGYYVSVRYEWQAGSRATPLGGAGTGTGSGSVHGFLFLDENDNGLMDAGEPGAPNVTVLLNGRFPTRTNAEGRFEFPSVAAGDHELRVVPDNIPLPWTVTDDGRTRIEIGVRERTFVALAARRQR